MWLCYHFQQTQYTQAVISYLIIIEPKMAAYVLMLYEHLWWQQVLERPYN